MENKIVFLVVFLATIIGSEADKNDTKCSLDMDGLEHCIMKKSEYLGQYLSSEGYDPLSIGRIQLRYNPMKINVNSATISGMRKILPQSVKINKNMIKLKLSLSASLVSDLDVALSFFTGFRGKLSVKCDNITIVLGAKLTRSPISLKESSVRLQLGTVSISLKPIENASTFSQSIVETLAKRQGKRVIEANKQQLETRLSGILEKTMNEIFQH
nr:Sy-JHBP-like protein [Parasacculina yatsui]